MVSQLGDWFSTLSCVQILYKQHYVGFYILYRSNRADGLFLRTFARDVVYIRSYLVA